MAGQFARWQCVWRRKRRAVSLSLGCHPFLLTFFVAALIAWSFIRSLEARLRPVIEEIAFTQAQNTMTAVVESAVSQNLAEYEVGYSDLVMIQRDSSGNIAALSMDTGKMNLLRAELAAVILNALENTDASFVQVPLGSVLNFELLWARGPAIRARAITVGTVCAEFESELLSAGVNQSLHRIWLKVNVPMTVLLAGRELKVPLQTQLLVGETVIVGKVPETYFSLQDPSLAN